MERLTGGLKDIFSTILKDTGEANNNGLPQIIVLSGNGHVIAPGGTVHVVHNLQKEAAALSPNEGGI